MSDRIAILCDAGEGIGYGHLTRCSSLNEFFNSNDKTAKLICHWYEKIVNSDFDFENCNWKEKSAVKDIANDCDVVIVDSYKIGADQYFFLSKLFKKLIVIDDYKRLDSFQADLVVNPNVYGNSIEYDNPSIGGKDYIILRDSFRKNNTRVPINSKINSILVTMGGSDYRQLLPYFMNDFKKMPYRFTFVCGSNSYAAKLSKVNNSKNINLLGFVNEEKMLRLMLGHDIAVSACGQTLHELARTGCPALGIIIDKDQQLNADYYLSSGFLQKCYKWNEVELYQKLISQIENFTQTERSECSNIGTKIIDGNGVNRIYEKVMSL